MGLTDTLIKSAKPKDKRYKISDEKGLYLLVLPSGGKYFQLDYRFVGKRKTLAIGVYPEITLKQARDKLDEARRMLRDGIDPLEVRKAKKHSSYIESANKLYNIAEEWFAKNKVKWSSDYAEEKWRKLEINIFPYLGDRPIKNITPLELLDVIRKIEARGAIETARRTKSIVGEIYVYAIATNRADRNISLDLTGALAAKPPVKHMATITDPKEIGGLMRAIDGYTGTFVVKCALEISPYVMLRPAEVATAEWAHIDLNNRIWKIPEGKMKMGRIHMVPLSRQVVTILEKLLSLSSAYKYVFPSIRSKTRHMNTATVNAAIRRMGYTGEEMCSHGFRGMASTILHENRFDSEVIEMQLAHVETNKVKAAYNHAKYLAQRTEMMQWWADYLDRLKSIKG